MPSFWLTVPNTAWNMPRSIFTPSVSGASKAWLVSCLISAATGLA